MGYHIDPEGNETRILHALVDFHDKCKSVRFMAQFLVRFVAQLSHVAQWLNSPRRHRALVHRYTNPRMAMQ